MTEKKGFAETSSAVELDNEEYRLKKQQIKDETRNIKIGETALARLEIDHKRSLTEVELAKEELDLKLELYAEHGEKFINTGKWKKFVIKGLKFEIQRNNDQSKFVEDSYLHKLNDITSQNMQRTDIIKQLKVKCKQLKKDIKWSAKERKRIYN